MYVFGMSNFSCLPTTSEDSVLPVTPHPQEKWEGTLGQRMTVLGMSRLTTYHAAEGMSLFALVGKVIDITCLSKDNRADK